MLCAKLTDDFLFSGSMCDLKWFDEQIRKRFKVGETTLDGRMNFNGAGDIQISMEAYMGRVAPISIELERRKSQDSPLTPKELTEHRWLAEMLNWAGRATITVACYAASEMQQKLANARVKHLCSANGMIAEIHKLSPRIMYKSPKSTVTDSFVAVFSDAAFNISAARSYG